MDLTELRAAIATDPTVRKLLVQLMRQEMTAPSISLCPSTHLLREHAAPAGMITYEEARQIMDCSPNNIRLLVSRGHVNGGNGYVVLNDLVRYALGHSSKRSRISVHRWLTQRAQYEARKVAREEVRALLRERYEVFCPTPLQHAPLGAMLHTHQVS